MNFKTIHSGIIACILIGSLTVSCDDDFLEVTPKGSLIAESVYDYDLLLDDPLLREASNVSVPMGDEVAAVDPFFSTIELRERRFFKWEADIYNSDQKPQELQTSMTSLYSYNKIINEVGATVDGTDELREQLEAEARVGRALSYFILINYYGKPYDAATASSDLGFPIIEYSDISSTDFSRNTVQEVYDFIIDDIEQALPFLPRTVKDRNRISAAAAEALYGKVLMSQQKFDKALVHLDLASDYSKNAQVELGIYDYNEEFLDGGVFTPASPFFGPATINRNLNKEVLYDKGFVNAWSYVQNEFVINPETASLFNSSDLRLNFYSDAEFFGFEPFYPKGMLRKMGPLFQQFGIYLPDIYLLNIEANARLGFLEDAVSKLETFRAKRMPVEDAEVPSVIATDKDKLIAFIFEERLRELALTGYRWFDMRRLSVDPDYSDLVGYSHNLYNEEGEVLETYELTPDRFVLRFGDQVLSQNPNLIENP
ncbi:RagB/SusD family nutrient uptake outer membrane protein [Zunongwangia sp.]|uniref:RagB/SusD family nutrient uptake outer membrane protein n=1 Tax=Zunongwangia sp. TaxID=1965325 RepID=UPI003AA8DB22